MKNTGCLKLFVQNKRKMLLELKCCTQKDFSSLVFASGQVVHFCLWMQHLFGWPSCLDHPHHLPFGQKSLVLLGINAKSQRFSVNLFFDTDSLWYVIWNRFRFCLYFTYMTDSFWKRKKEKEGRIYSMSVL